MSGILGASGDGEGVLSGAHRVKGGGLSGFHDNGKVADKSQTPCGCAGGTRYR